MRRLALLGSFVALVLALMSPLDAFSDELSAAHMAQHLALMSVAAPLAVLGHSRLLLLQGLPAGWRRPVGLAWSRIESWPNGGAAIRKPLVPWALQAVVLWMWHVPLLYGLALSVPAVHDLQHLTFFAAAYLFWQVILHRRSYDASIRGAAVLYLFATSLHASALGVLMTFSPRPWYGEFASTALRWGLTPIEDQQLAGLIMWIPGCTIYAVAAIVLLYGLLGGNSDTSEPAQEVLPPSNPIFPIATGAAEA